MEQIEVGESICALCDDGGDLTCCDGPCLRSFHATREAARKSVSQCLSLGLDEYDLLQKQVFICRNCENKQHQCFKCSKLGKSSGPGQEVFVCNVSLCARFYHKTCLSELGVEFKDEEGFTCPLHKCRACGEPEVYDDPELRIFPCRRCPRAWHRRCLGSSIHFEGEEDNEDVIRGWIVGDTRFLYCLRHDIDPDLYTPARNHIQFPIVRSARPLAKERRGIKFLSEPSTSSSSRQDTTPEFDQTEVENVVRKLIRDSKARVPIESVTSQLFEAKMGSSYRKKPPYKLPPLGKIQSLTQSYKLGTCRPQDIKTLKHIKNMLTAYMSPIRFGKRYTSFGRHFTKLSKLQEIVDILHWYLLPGDTVADFCCGRNDFSMLLSKKMEEMSKLCYFRNFDLIQPANTFNFERRDYMTIQREMLPPANSLIIGLNPPFGFEGDLASKFVEHVATLSPKIIILIAPPNTRQPHGYEVVWKNSRICAGEAFYLPGSTDMNGNIMDQFNNEAPPLTLYSRRDWFPVHRQIAMDLNHLRFS